MLRNVEINGFPSVIVNGREVVPLPGVPPNPNFFRGQTKVTDGQSFYDALQVQLKRRYHGGFQIEGSYTWSKTIDDSTSGVGSTDFEVEGLSSTMYSTKADRGLSALHQGHNVVVNGLVALPSLTRWRVASWVLGGWQVGGIASVASGTPFSVIISGTNVNDNGRNAGGSKQRRPDWRGGSFDDAINEGNPDQYFDPTKSVSRQPRPTGIYPATRSWVLD